MTEISWLCYKAIIVFFSPFLDWPLCVHWSFLDNFWVLCNCSEWSKAIKTGPPREARNSLEESLRPQSIHGVHLYVFQVILFPSLPRWKVPVMSVFKSKKTIDVCVGFELINHLNLALLSVVPLITFCFELRSFLAIFLLQVQSKDRKSTSWYF